jgi:hypothetical protein
MIVRRKEFVSEIKRLKLELAELSGRLGELEKLANPTGATSEENPSEEDDNSLAAKVAIALSKSRINK